MRILIAIFFVALTIPATGEDFRGCCSHHVGISHGQPQTGQVICEDDTLSPNCTVDDGSGGSIRGCCNDHKGVKGFDLLSGKLICRDDTFSPTCKVVPLNEGDLSPEPGSGN